MVFDSTDEALVRERRLDALRRSSERVFASLDGVEVETVARCVAFADRAGLRRVARVATRLGNGWVYPAVSIVAATGQVGAPLRFLVAATLSLLLAFLVYPLLKNFLARARPSEYDPSLVSDLEPLDHYSCPSGHAMTAAAYGVPLVFANPAALPFVFVFCVVIGWSRVALGHHYVSDVILGTILGAGVACGVSALLF